MGYVGNQTTTSYSSMDKQVITGDGGTGYTLSHAVANAQEIEVFVNNVRQEPAVAYTATGTALTMTGNVESTDDFYVVYQGKAVQTVVPPDGSVTSAKIADDAVTSAKLDTNIAIAGTLQSNGLTVDGGATFTVSTDATGRFADNVGEVGSGNFCLQVSNSGQSALKPLGFRAEDIRFATGSARRMYIDESGHIYLDATYANTTGGSANVHIGTSGELFRSTSSQRYKNTIADATHGLTELLALRPVTYKGNNDGDTVYGGLIAEEVHDAGLTEFVEYNDDNEPDALAYGNMVSLCIKAIQELSAKNDALEARITALEAN